MQRRCCATAVMSEVNHQKQHSFCNVFSQYRHDVYLWHSLLDINIACTVHVLPGWQSLIRHCPYFDCAIAALAGTNMLSVCGSLKREKDYASRHVWEALDRP